MSENPWKRLESKIAYKSKWRVMREDRVLKPDKEEGMYNVVEAGPAVYVVAVNDKDEVCLVGQWRYPTDSYSWEVPGGSANIQDLLTSAKEELQEETGFVAEDWVQAGSFKEMSGLCDGVGYVFVARNLVQSGEHTKAEEGISRVKWVKVSSLFSMIKKGEISDAMTITSLTKFLLGLDESI